ncbi:MAG: hypothetical protein ACYC69_17290 [Thermodesulfovibrionales bacterium]
MKRVEFVGHRGRQILFLDFSNCSVPEILRTIKEAKAVISEQPEQSLLTLSDVTDAAFNETVRIAMKEFTLHNKPYVKAAAVVGVTGLKRIIFDGVLLFSKRKMSAFDGLDPAKDWLADQG